jgi:hypothetical protein
MKTSPVAGSWNGAALNGEMRSWRVIDAGGSAVVAATARSCSAMWRSNAFRSAARSGRARAENFGSSVSSVTTTWPPPAVVIETRSGPRACTALLTSSRRCPNGFRSYVFVAVLPFCAVKIAVTVVDCPLTSASSRSASLSSLRVSSAVTTAGVNARKSRPSLYVAPPPGDSWMRLKTSTLPPVHVTRTVVATGSSRRNSSRTFVRPTGTSSMDTSAAPDVSVGRNSNRHSAASGPILRRSTVVRNVCAPTVPLTTGKSRVGAGGAASTAQAGGEERRTSERTLLARAIRRRNTQSILRNSVRSQHRHPHTRQ